MPEIANNSSTPPQQINAWMISFADLLSLILTFFVMLYSMSAIVEPKWHKIKESLTERLNPDKEEPEVLFTAKKSIHMISVKSAMELSYLYSLIREKINAVPSLSTLKFEQRSDSLVIALPGGTAFADGDKELTSQAIEMLNLLEDILHQISNRVDIYGYAPPSERELSIARAVAVAKGLQDFGYGQPIKAFGLPISSGGEKELYGDSQRVDIVIHGEKAGYAE